METEESAPPTAGDYARVIKWSSWVFAILAGLVALTCFITLEMRPDDEPAAPPSGASLHQVTPADPADTGGRARERQDSLYTLVLLPCGGYLLGMAVAVLFAPSSFLSSESGRRWLEMVGTKQIWTARVVAAIFTLFGLAFLTFLLLATLTNNFKQPLFGA